MKHAIAVALLMAALGPLRAEEEEVEIVVDVMGRGAKFDPAAIHRDDQSVIQAVFHAPPGTRIEELLPDREGNILAVGTMGDGPVTLPHQVLGGAAGGRGFVASLSPDLRKLRALTLLPPGFVTAERMDLRRDGSVAVAGRAADGLMAGVISSDLRSLTWTRSVGGDDVASVSVGPDDSVLVCPVKHPFLSRIVADGQSLIPFGSESTFRTDGANPKVAEAWWKGLGYVEKNYKGVTYHHGGTGGAVALDDGTFAFLSSHFVRMPDGGPDFDLMLIRFNAEGQVLWASNLLDGMPAPSDQKQPLLRKDRFNGELLAAAVQHGHFEFNLVWTAGAYLNPHAWLTGDIMIGWFARIDPATGKPKAASYFFPEKPGPLRGGKRTANSLFPRGITADQRGNIYLTGLSAWRLQTTLYAFQTDPLGGTSFLAVFGPDLSRPHYVGLITAPGLALRATSVAVAAKGPVISSTLATENPGTAKFIEANAALTDYLVPEPPGPDAAVLTYYPSSAWLP